MTNEPEMELLLHELESLKRELKAQIPEIDWSAVTPAQLMKLFNQTIGGRLPRTQVVLLEDIERNLEGVAISDFADPDVLRGLATLTYYNAQMQADTLREPLIDKLQKSSWYPVLCQMRNDLAGKSMQDVLDPDIWKGLWRITLYSAQRRTLALFQEDEDID